jgi:2-amino-5-formylamino-6-ribosylaminopyrimidin-4(3H)-one 5'-monophosphate deformylase
LPGINTGRHQTIERIIDELKTALLKAKETLNIEAVVLVNAHGGNEPLKRRLSELEGHVGLRIVFNDKIVELEGPHAATGELSIGAAIGIADVSRLKEHVDFNRHPEVGFVGLKEARKRYSWAEQHAQEVSERGVQVDLRLGRKLLQLAISDVVKNIGELQAT